MKKDILNILKINKGSYVSGEYISSILNISRMSVCNAIKKLKEDDYIISSSRKKGYMLEDPYKYYDIELLKDNLLKKGFNLIHFNSIDSTNKYAKNNISSLENKTIIIANSQDNGKGRKNRDFYSPKNDGIYMTLIFKDDFNESIIKMTALTSLAIVKAIKTLYDIDLSIKWINDIFYNRKKLCGILCEATVEMNTRKFDSILIGIGINVYNSDIPEELKDIITSLKLIKDIEYDKNIIVLQIIDEILNIMSNVNDSTLLEQYKASSIVINEEVIVSQANNEYVAKVSNINDEYNLIVESNNKKILLNSGEISLKLK